MSDKAKKIFFPVIIIVLCAAVIATVLAVTLPGKGAGDSHIIIEETGQGGVHVLRGELDISLMRERLETRTLDGDGLPVKSTDGTLTDFSKSRDNIFGIDDDILIGPGCYFSAQMTVENKKPYAFDYWLEIVPEKGGSLLADQLELTVIIDGETFIKRTLGSRLITEEFPKVSAGRKGKFTVKLEYLDVKDNNETKNTTLAFDMTVHAKLSQS